jgi:hypothetical protein
MSRVRHVVIEKLVGGDWVETKIKHLVPGNNFRMWMYIKDDWELYWHNNQSEFVAMSEPFLHHEHGLWTVMTEEGSFADGDKNEG